MPASSAVPDNLTEFLNKNAGCWGVFDRAYLDDPCNVSVSYEPGLQQPIREYAVDRLTAENVRGVLYVFNTPNAFSLNRARAQAVVSGLNHTLALDELHGLSLN